MEIEKKHFEILSQQHLKLFEVFSQHVVQQLFAVLDTSTPVVLSFTIVNCCSSESGAQQVVIALAAS